MEPMVQLSAESADQLVVDILEYYVKGIKKDNRSLMRDKNNLTSNKLEDIQYNARMIESMEHVITYFKVQPF
jgi:hypothetical protein